MAYEFRARSQIMQSAGDFHNKVAETFFRVSEHISDDAETLYAGDDVFGDDTVFRNTGCGG